jgi:colicin import membrane protein
VEQAQLELQLKVWKELAISKQVLMRSATDALKLDPNCSQDELKQALDKVIKKIAESDSSVAIAQAEARQAIAAMDKKLTAAVLAQTAAQTTAEEMRAAHENATREIATERAMFGKELQQLKNVIADKDKALKAINTALADTPDNVVKKLKALRKEKQDEADGRRLVEATVATVRKEKREQDEKMAEQQERTTKLVTLYKDLHGVTTKLHEQLKPLVTDEKSMPALPELDTKLLEEIEQPNKSKTKK